LSSYVERLEDKTLRQWYVQCRRYEKAGPKTLITAVDDSLEHCSTPPEVLLVVVACDVSKAARERYEVYALSKGVTTSLLWTASKLEAKLYSEHTDLLFAFFGISTSKLERSRETTVKLSIAMKKKMIKLIGGFKTGHRLIIRSIDDDYYPIVKETVPEAISGWFRPEYYGFYHGGVEVILGIEYVAVSSENSDEEGWVDHWFMVDVSKMKSTIWTDDDNFTHVEYDFETHIDRSKFSVGKAFLIGRIPYRNIVECDEFGDEYYKEPHLYCKYADQGEPYEQKVFRLIGDDHHFRKIAEGHVLEPKNRIPPVLRE
jgi:hypothetical protein